jgi:regulator of protease activity HflC (stomatin/prohibitin superfamily)
VVGIAVVAATLLTVGLLALSRAIVLVPDQHAYVVVRLGTYHRTVVGGRHLIVPLIDAVVRRYPLDEQTAPLSATCRTRDGENVLVEGSLGFRVVDPAQAYVAVADVAEFATGLATSIARREIGKLRLAEARERTGEVATTIVSEANEAITGDAKGGRRVGIEVLACRLSRIDTPALIG